MADLRPNRGTRGAARLSSLNKKCSFCENCIIFINGQCSGQKRSIQDCSEYVPDKPQPRRYSLYDQEYAEDEDFYNL